MYGMKLASAGTPVTGSLMLSGLRGGWIAMLILTFAMVALASLKLIPRAEV